jgi:hypothetical protein
MANESITRPGMDPSTFSLERAASEITDLDQDQKRRDARGRYVRAAGDALSDRDDDDHGGAFGEDDEDDLQDDEDDPQDDLQDDGEDDDDDVGDDDEEEEAPSARRYKVIVDGEERQVTLDELTKGYGLNASLTQRGQKLAEERRAFETHATSVVAERQAYAALLGEVAKYLEGQAPSEAIVNQLMLQDPAEGFRAKQVRDQIIAKAGEFKQAFGAMVQGILQQQRAALQSELAQAMKELPTLIPEWRDPKRLARERDEIKAAMLSWGFSEDDLAQITDPRAMLVARKAWLYDRLLASRRDKLQPKSKGQPRAIEPGAKPNRNRGQDAGRARALRERARTSGSIDDVAALIAATEKL